MNKPFAKTSRRNFLKTVGATALTAPFVTSGLRAAPASGKLNHASFGSNGMAWGDISSFRNSPHFNLVAVADVDKNNFARIQKEFPDAKIYQDGRELLEKHGDELDSVNVSTPDHMHGPFGMLAMERGLHVYGQKPLAQNLAECRAMTLKAREKKVMTQMGIQISSAFTERLAVQLIHDGAIGKVKAVHSFSDKKWGDTSPRPNKQDTPPENFDWDLWLGVGTDRPFIGGGYYHPGNWRKRRDFGTGTFGDMGCHIFSGWFRALGLTAPISVKSLGAASTADNWNINSTIEYVFPKTQYTIDGNVPVTWYDGDSRPPADIAAMVGGNVPGQGSIIIGEGGALLAPHMSTPRLFPADKFKGQKYPKLEPRDHYMEFLDACRNGGDKKPSANFDYAGPLTEAVLLGCLATLFPNELLKWDVEKMIVTDNEAATKQVRREYRKGWEIAGV